MTLHREGGLVDTETRHQSFQGVVAMFNTAGAITAPAGMAVLANTREGRRTKAEKERAMDQVLADSFPASDPPPWEAITDVVIVGGGSAAQRTMNQLRATVAGSIGVALLFPIAILIVGLPIVLALRGMAEAAAWVAALLLK